MMKYAIGVVMAVVFSSWVVAPVQAQAALRVQPTSYRAELKQGEKKLGFVDVSNPTKETLMLTTSVSAFRQVADNGSLQFSQSVEISAGIIPDLDAFELRPLEAMRVYFQLDGTKLPPGDVFGVLFFTATSASGGATITQPVRLGVLFSLVNGTPGPRVAEVAELRTSFIHFGKSISGYFSVKNNASAGQATGFYPKVRVSVAPFDSSRIVEAPLVFAGRARTVPFDVPTDRFGLYQISVQTGSSEKSQWIFAMTGWGRFVPSIVFLVLAVTLILRRHFFAEK